MNNIILIFILFIGLSLVVGAYKRWGWLVNPPEEWSWFYSQSWLKRIIGAKGLLIYTYLLGTAFIIASTVGLYFSYL